MKITNIFNGEPLYKTKGFKENKCPYCYSFDVFNNCCNDCGYHGEPLYYYERHIKEYKHVVSFSFDLVEEQKRASTFFLNHYLKKKNANLFAVCGSGKTEVMFETILTCLNEGKKPLIAIPRKEIVKELYQRMKKSFPKTRISFLDGFHHNDNSELLISTVNQLLHYENEFDLIIIDEADAFPYANSPYLHRLIGKSLKDGGVIFLMSATKKERIKYDSFTMKRRYHNNDLVMPSFIKEKPPYKVINHKLSDIIKNENRKFIIYVPSIEKAKNISLFLGVPFISSKSRNADVIVSRIKNGSIRILVSTTILERGITINNLDVIVLDADNRIFTHQTLIQIAGRVGRSFNDPVGNVYFFYKRNSLKFLLVKRYIRRMNS